MTTNEAAERLERVFAKAREDGRREGYAEALKDAVNAIRDKPVIAPLNVDEQNGVAMAVMAVRALESEEG